MWYRSWGQVKYVASLFTHPLILARLKTGVLTSYLGVQGASGRITHPSRLIILKRCSRTLFWTGVFSCGIPMTSVWERCWGLGVWRTDIGGQALTSSTANWTTPLFAGFEPLFLQSIAVAYFAQSVDIPPSSGRALKTPGWIWRSFGFSQPLDIR